MQLIEDSRFSKAKSQGPLKTLVIEEPSSTSQSKERKIKFHVSEDPTGSGYTFSRIGWHLVGIHVFAITDRSVATRNRIGRYVIIED